ncbi:MAG TPA: hypothetical protein VN207_07110 [Ktedonobacteraceae bacterium]|nr:hypothetical protein [Ktedonobacteraceae bacterium]
MNNSPYDPNNPYSQQTAPGQYPTFNQQPGQPSYPQWPQQTPPSPQFNQWPQQTPPPPQFNQQPPYPQLGHSIPATAQPPAQQPPLKPYSDGVLCMLFLLNIIFWICAFIGGGVGNFGKSALTGSIVAFFIMDWKGFISLDGWINPTVVSKL